MLPFFGIGQAWVRAHVVTRNDCIRVCDECIELCRCIVEEERTTDLGLDISKSIPQPRMIKEFLDQYVVGQERPKKVIIGCGYKGMMDLTLGAKELMKSFDYVAKTTQDAIQIINEGKEQDFVAIMHVRC